MLMMTSKGSKHKVVVNPPRCQEPRRIRKQVHVAAQSAVNPDVPVSNDVRELLECPVCFDIMHPPIYQCSSGHTLCSGCKPRMQNRCPTCTHELGNIRCLALEKAAKAVELPCKYQDSGCLGVFPYCSKLDHESECSFRPYKCPLPDSSCSILGDIPFILNHVKDYHKLLVHDDSNNFSISYPMYDRDGVGYTTWESEVYSCFGQHFCLHFVALQLGVASTFIAFLQFMGNDEAAKNYNYTLQCRGNGRNLMWRGVPRSIRDSHSKVCDSLDGLIIQRNFFASGEGNEVELKVHGCVVKRPALFGLIG